MNSPPQGAAVDKKNEICKGTQNEPVDRITRFPTARLNLNVGKPDLISNTLCVSFVPLCAVRSVVFTVDPTESGRAGAGVAVNTVRAVGSVPTGVALTLVDVLLALWTPEAR